MCNKEKFWPVLCDAIGRPELGSDPYYASFADRLRNRDQLTEVLYDALSTHTTDEWIEKFAGRLLAALVNEITKALDSPFARSSGQIISHEVLDGSSVTSTGLAIRIPVQVLLANGTPAMAQDLDEVLSEIGVSREQLEKLEARKIV